MLKALYAMNIKELRSFCADEVANFEYSVPDLAIGDALSSNKVEAQLRDCKASLVKPYERIFELRCTFEQMKHQQPEHKIFWVVANDKDGYLVFYDTIENEFGLATYDINAPDNTPTTIGVRGDFVGTFMAR